MYGQTIGPQTVVHDDFEKIIIELSDIDLGSGEQFWYSFKVEDQAGNESLTYYSEGLYYKPEPPKIKNLSGLFSEGKLNFHWSIEEGSLPIEGYYITLKKGDELIIDNEDNNDGSLQFWSMNFESIEDLIDIKEGYYTFCIQSYDAIGGGEITASKSVLVDCTAPVVETPEVSPYVSDKISFDVKIQDSSMIDEWKYRIGVLGGPGCITGGWIYKEGDLGHHITAVGEKDLEFSILPGDAVEDKQQLLVEIVARGQIR